MLALAASRALTAERDTINGEAGLPVSQDVASAQCAEGKKQWVGSLCHVSTRSSFQ